MLHKVRPRVSVRMLLWHSKCPCASGCLVSVLALTPPQALGSGTPTFRHKVVWRALVCYEREDEVPQLLREAGDSAIWWMAEGQVSLCA